MITPLYIKTHNSLLSSMIKINDLISFANRNNIKVLSITDNKMYGVMEFYKMCISNSIKPIVGLEVKIDNYKILLYCKNYIGYKNLLKITSLENITVDVLDKYNNDLICIVLYESLSLYDKLSLIYKDIFKGYKNISEKMEMKGDNLVYACETLYLEESDSEYIKYLTSIKTGEALENKIMDNSLEGVINKLNNIDYDIDNNKRITDMCDLKMEVMHDLIPSFKCPDNLSSYDYLKQLCVIGLKRIFGDTVKKAYIDRLKYELDIINKMGFCNYFLIVWDYVGYARNNNILVGPGRGSAAGSLVSFVLNITTVDPIKHDLLFERFLNPERVTMPDIDIDFEYNKRGDVVNYCINKYGVKNVCPIITFGTLGAKQAIRDVGRCMGVNLKIIDRLCGLIDSRLSLVDNLKNESIKKYIGNDDELLLLYKVASRLEGLKRHTSIHAAGIVMCDIPLDEVIPLSYNNGHYTTGYSMEYLEELGLLKMDFLALRNLTMISDILSYTNIKFDDIPDNDKSALDIFNKANLSGIFQFESEGMINFIRKLKVNSFDDIVASIALYRPGPMDNIDLYIKRKNTNINIDYYTKELVDILKPTYGVIIYQEQIMQIANVMAGYSFGEADILRRAMSKKKQDVMLNERDKFVSRSIERGFNEKVSNDVYDLILKFASYGFNKAHSVAYSYISYRMAYLKAHYRVYFMKCLLDSNINSEVKTREYIYESRSMGINLLLPSINFSGDNYLIKGDDLIYPINNIKNVGGCVIKDILNERDKGLFLDIFDFVKRCYGKSVNKKVIESLILAGCFSEFSFNKKTLINNIDVIINYGELGGLLGDELKPVLKECDDYSNFELMDKEIDIFGFYFTNHPVSDLKRKYKGISINDIKDYFDKNVPICALVDSIKEIKTKKGDTMCFITGSDEISSTSLVLFPSIYTGDIAIGDVIVAMGRVEKRFDKYQVVVNSILFIARKGVVYE